ncbi:hypothetical protein LITTLEDOG_50 [Serratia phage vB_SmaS_LittleDog]|uniref:Uncharacterized protein n=2 Tax=Bonzeevirus TaxID=3152507 RepID=A0A7T3TL04_9CAUD|nr:hypothetical protein QJS25_gp55 [Serratia phage vB_SmaS_Bonzee]YP_010774229.1 hypothetical protein QJS26_gp48 [Serratia phage vB_SmaS_Stoker]YP_010774366.1 hypothetical protein QJS28_gp53 [Serratia phage vB_SmaS_Bigdog]QPX75387.1 hypothetical protein [Serratia phage vB_SmaS_Opt-148]UGO51792.1 hypothetical protein SWAIN_50 [Serratia phage vB_SmaS_Swain]UGO51856.1 hypothetical protein CARROT_50 [Serratia phage vB_SmaS_Carrot]UGO53074.1 hypothetical protein LITTLEDOG_50 [Serratia phage vB_Sma
MNIVAFEVTDKRGRKRIIEAGGAKEENARMWGETLEPLVYQSEAIPCDNCMDTILRHGLEEGGAVISCGVKK